MRLDSIPCDLSQCRISVDFDVDDGPVIEGIYPPSILLPAESENMSVIFCCPYLVILALIRELNSAFSSFPDSLQFDQGSQSHSFRIREQLKIVHTDKRPPTNDGFIYGYSYFTQKRDATSKRGYEQVSCLSFNPSHPSNVCMHQRSTVILTQHQYPALFSSLLSIFGPLFQAHGTPMLEAACHNIATWYDYTLAHVVLLIAAQSEGVTPLQEPRSS